MNIIKFIGLVYGEEDKSKIKYDGWDKIKRIENTINVDSLSDRKYHWEINCSFNDNNVNTSFP